MTHWHSLFLFSEQVAKIRTVIHDYFSIHHYTIYNPFSGLPGMTYPKTIKLFLAPVDAGWLRILVDGNTDVESLAQDLSKVADCLSVRLEGSVASIYSYQQGTAIPLSTWIETHLRTDSHKHNGNEDTLLTLNEQHIGDVPLSALSDDMQAKAQHINLKQANNLFKKVSKRFLSASKLQDAQKLLQGHSDWEGEGGQSIRQLMATLTIPDNWHSPDFASVRTAYTLKVRAQSHSASDETILRSIPNISAYQPLYAGKFD